MKKIQVISADITALTGYGNMNNSDWVIVFSNDEFYPQLLESVNGVKEEEALDETDGAMWEKGFTSYSYNDLIVLEEKAEE